MDHLTKAAFDAINTFPWHAHGVGVVGDIQNRLWAERLAVRVVDAVVETNKLAGGQTDVFVK